MKSKGENKTKTLVQRLEKHVADINIKFCGVWYFSVLSGEFLTLVYLLVNESNSRKLLIEN